MLTIRAAQMDALARERRKDFEQRLASYLAGVLAGTINDGAYLEKQVRLGVESGLRFFDTEKDIARYCEIVMTRLGGWDAFDHPAPALQMLQPKVVEAARRLDNFERWLTTRRKR